MSPQLQWNSIFVLVTIFPLLPPLIGGICYYCLQFSTHDVVVLKPNKADLGAPSLGQGVVYRLKVSSTSNNGIIIFV